MYVEECHGQKRMASGVCFSGLVHPHGNRVNGMSNGGETFSRMSGLVSAVPWAGRDSSGGEAGSSCAKKSSVEGSGATGRSPATEWRRRGSVGADDPSGSGGTTAPPWESVSGSSSGVGGRCRPVHVGNQGDDGQPLLTPTDTTNCIHTCTTSPPCAGVIGTECIRMRIQHTPGQWCIIVRCRGVTVIVW